MKINNKQHITKDGLIKNNPSNSITSIVVDFTSLSNEDGMLDYFKRNNIKVTNVKYPPHNYIPGVTATLISTKRKLINFLKSDYYEYTDRDVKDIYPKLLR